MKQTQENCLINKTTSLSIHINLAKDTDTGLLTHLFLDGSLTTVFLDFLFFKHTKDIVSSALSRKKDTSPFMQLYTETMETKLQLFKS